MQVSVDDHGVHGLSVVCNQSVSKNNAAYHLPSSVLLHQYCSTILFGFVLFYIGQNNSPLIVATFWSVGFALLN